MDGGAVLAAVRVGLRSGRDASMIEELLGGLAPDPALKGLARLAAPGGRDRLLKELRAAVPSAGKDLRFTPIKQRPGQRAVVRIEGGSVSWYAKFLKSDRPQARRELERIAAEAERLGIHVPAPVAWLPRFRLLVTRHAAGSPLLGRPERAWPEPAELFGQVGTALAALHRSLSVPVKDGGSEVEIARVRGVRDGLRRRRNDLLDGFDRELEAWEEVNRRAGGTAGAAGGGAPATAETGAPAAALHGDFHPAQVLVADLQDGSERWLIADGGPDPLPVLSILDWDEACRGEAERDAGNFLAHLTLESLQGRLSETRAKVLGLSFRRGYGERSSLRSDRLDWYRRGSLLRLAALYADPGFGLYPPNPAELPERLLAAGSPGNQ